MEPEQLPFPTGPDGLLCPWCTGRPPIAKCGHHGPNLRERYRIQVHQNTKLLEALRWTHARIHLPHEDGCPSCGMTCPVRAVIRETQVERVVLIKCKNPLPEGLVVYMGGEHIVLCHKGRHTVVTGDGYQRDDGPCWCKRERSPSE